MRRFLFARRHQTWYNAGGATGCLGAYRAAGAQSYTVSRVNWANPANPLVEGNGAVPWSSALGWGPFTTGSTYLRTGIAPGDAYSMIVQFSSYVSGATTIAGSAKIPPTTYFLIQPNRVGKHYYYRYSAVSIAPGIAAGNMAIAGTKGYVDGDFETNLPVTSLGSTVEIYIGALNLTGVPDQYANCYISYLAIYNNDIGADAVAAVVAGIHSVPVTYGAITTYASSIGT